MTSAGQMYRHALFPQPRPTEMLSAQPARLYTNITRSFYTSVCRRDFVAPPHPVSHIRPILYDDPPSQLPTPYLRHPYSLSEFKNTVEKSSNDLEFQFKVHRQQLDSLHQSFWLDSNTRFYAAKEEVLRSLPQSATPLEKEVALSTFYCQWAMQEKSRTDVYTDEWRQRNYELIKIGIRVELQNISNWISLRFTSSSHTTKP